MSTTTNVIQLLPDSLANQIAAGEVVQRPASVVKELLENAIDAGATSIQLIIKDAGKSLIQVIDDGKGMNEVDARMCFERHATSKLKTTEDLFNILTYGFRGEAMASIAAVAHVELKTKNREEELGHFLKIQGSQFVEQEKVACADGTSISVKNLFFNIPARRNFLKSNPVETKHIIDEFQRVALANPQIALSFIQNDLEVYNLTAGNLSKRIVSLLGKSYQKGLLYIEEKTDWLEISGFVGVPEIAKKTRGDQFFMANGRFIKHGYLHHAVVEGYEGLMSDGSHPFYVLNIEIDPKHIDVNVHPTKTEVKFDDDRTVYAILKAAVRKALGVHHVAPSIDFEQDINFGIQTFAHRDYSAGKAPFEIPDDLKIKPQNTYTPPPKDPNLKHWDKLYTGFERKENPFDSFENASFLMNEEDETEELITVNIQSKINLDLPLEEKNSLVDESANVFQLHDKYIFCQVKSGMMLINRFLALERILYEKYLHSSRHSVTTQQLLFPQNLDFNPADFSLVMELKEEIHLLGFRFAEFGNSSILIEGVPSDAIGNNEKEIFESLIEQFKQNKKELSIGTKENLSKILAKRFSKSANKSLSKLELHHIIDKLFACSHPHYAPDGEKIFSLLDFNAIDTLLK